MEVHLQGDIAVDAVVEKELAYGVYCKVLEATEHKSEHLILLP